MTDTHPIYRAMLALLNGKSYSRIDIGPLDDGTDIDVGLHAGYGVADGDGSFVIGAGPNIDEHALVFQHTPLDADTARQLGHALLAWADWSDGDRASGGHQQ